MFSSGGPALVRKLEDVVEPEYEAVGPETSRRIHLLLPAPLILEDRFDIAADKYLDAWRKTVARVVYRSAVQKICG